MSVDSVTEFLEHLRESGVLPPSQLDALDREPGPRRDSVAALADDLVKRGWLTPFQADRLLEGRPRELVLGPYRLLERLGKGGMGEVFKAWHCRLERFTALKIIRKERLAGHGAVERFLREARAAAQLNHPHVVLVYDGNQIGDTHYLAMEYVEGTTLAQLVKESGPLPLPLACAYVRQAALGLQHAHGHGLVHRDIKPSNLIVVPGPPGGGPGQIKVLDFGLARFTSEEADPNPLTGAGQMMGTVGFIAPEQAADARSADIRADIFGLGCTLFFLLTGRAPRAGVAPGDVLGERLPVEQHGVIAVLARMMAFCPADRYATPGEAAAALLPFCYDPAGMAVPGEDVERQATVALPGPPGRSTPSSATPVERSAPKPADGSHRRHLVLGLCGAAALLALLAVLVARPWVPTPPSAPVEEPIPPPRLMAEEEPAAFTNSIGMQLVQIPAGRFTMGSPAGEVGRALAPEIEAPHEVWITRPFYMGACEVTQQQYQDVTGDNPSHFSPTGGGRQQVADLDPRCLPVESVTWEQANRFCRLLSQRPEEQKAGRVYRLPTEAEWEYACRAGTTGPFHFGDALSSDLANVNGKRPYGGAAAGESRPHPVAVGSFPANAFGLYDMHGNVWEWCADRYGPYRAGVQVDPRGPLAGDTRVCRGGAFLFAPADCRSAVRYARDPRLASEQIGFRVVCELQRPK
jgi:serine/threonine-protein kinase